MRARQQRGEADGRLIGVGLSFFVEQGAHGTSVLAAWGRPMVPGYEQATVRLTADGDLEIRVGTHSHGQGHETTYAQVAHEILGVDFDADQGVPGRHALLPLLHRHLGLALDGHGRRRGRAGVARCWRLARAGSAPGCCRPIRRRPSSRTARLSADAAT